MAFASPARQKYLKQLTELLQCRRRLGCAGNKRGVR